MLYLNHRLLELSRIGQSQLASFPLPLVPVVLHGLILFSDMFFLCLSVYACIFILDFFRYVHCST